MIVLVIIIFTLASGMFGFLMDRILWNKGKCNECGEPWQHFGRDSQGGNGYKCSNDHYAWVSWGADNKE